MAQKIVYTDDILALKGEEVEATRKEILSFAGHAVELDLTDDTADQVLERLRDLFAIGRPVKGSAPPGERKARRGETSRKEYAFTNGSRQAAIEYNSKLREWAKSIGEPVQRFPSGMWDYTRNDIKRRYAEHLKTGP